MCFIFLSNCWWIFSYLKVKQLWFLCFVCCLLQRFQHKICTWTINLIEITIFFVMFSITVSMKNKWKISTSLVYVLVIMDNRYNNSNIFFSLFSVFLMTQNFLQFSCFSKKRFKNDLSNFFVSMHRLLGGGSMTGFLREWHFVVVFFVRFDEKNQNRKLDTDKPETDFKCLLAPFHMRI